MISQLPRTDNSISNSSPKINSQNKENSEYLDKLNEYYRLKNEYESSYNNKKNSILKNESLNILQKKQKIQKIQRFCISCKNPVNTIFKHEGKYLYAICGSSKPCALNIKLYKGIFIPLPDLIDIFQESVEENKEQIIRSKLDLLFNFKNENEVITTFNSIKTELNDNLETLLEYKSSYIQITENIDNKSLILAKTESMHKYINNIKEIIKEFNDTNQIQLIREVITIYKEDLLPIFNSLRELKYKYFNMENGTLVRKIYTISDLLIPINKPSVEIFEIGDKSTKPITPDKSMDFSKLELASTQDITTDTYNNEDSQQIITGFHKQGDKLMIDDKEIANISNYDQNTQLLQTLSKINPTEASSKKYKFEMLYVQPHKPELFAINPDNGDMFIVDVPAYDNNQDKPTHTTNNPEKLKKPPRQSLAVKTDAVVNILKEQIMPPTRKMPFKIKKPPADPVV
jgi:hypothetical protein